MLFETYDWDGIEAISAETVQFGTLPFPLHSAPADQAIGSIRFDALPEGNAVAFSAELPPTARDHYIGTNPLIDILPSSGWGADGTGDALLHIVETPSGYAFGGVAVSYDQFRPVETLPSIDPLPNLLYNQDGQIWRVLPDGSAEVVIDFPDRALNFNMNTASSHGFFIVGSTQFWEMLRVDLKSGSSQRVPLRFAHDAELPIVRPFLFNRWLDDTTAVIGTWHSPEFEGPNQGHLSLLDITTGQITLLDEDAVLTSAPAVANGRIIWTTFEAPAISMYAWEEGVTTKLSPQLLLDHGATRNDTSAFSPSLTDSGQETWWLKGVRENAVTLALITDGTIRSVSHITPPAMGGFPSAPVWSPNNRWFAFQPWTSVGSMDRVQIHDHQGDLVAQLGIGSRNPQWYDENRLLYTQINGDKRELRLYHVETGEQVAVAFPDQAWLIDVLPHSGKGD